MFKGRNRGIGILHVRKMVENLRLDYIGFREMYFVYERLKICSTNDRLI
jgi:hypothetical protein